MQENNNNNAIIALADQLISVAKSMRACGEAQQKAIAEWELPTAEQFTALFSIMEQIKANDGKAKQSQVMFAVLNAVRDSGLDLSTVRDECDVYRAVRQCLVNGLKNSGEGQVKRA